MKIKELFINIDNDGLDNNIQISVMADDFDPLVYTINKNNFNNNKDNTIKSLVSSYYELDDNVKLIYE